MSGLTFNKDLAVRVRDLLTLKPELHNQGVWIERSPACGTAGCVAGWCSILSGRKAENISLPEYVFDLDGSDKYIEDDARDLLGIDEDTAVWLFRSHANEVREEYLATLNQLTGEEYCELPRYSAEDDNRMALERLNLLIDHDGDVSELI